MCASAAWIHLDPVSEGRTASVSAKCVGLNVCVSLVCAFKQPSVALVSFYGLVSLPGDPFPVSCDVMD